MNTPDVATARFVEWIHRSESQPNVITAAPLATLSTFIYRYQLRGAEANLVKYFAAKASREAANACIQFRDGFDIAHEYDIKRNSEARWLYQDEPIFANVILSHTAEHVLR